MAIKVKADVQALLKAGTDWVDVVETFLGGDYTTKRDAFTLAVATADDVPEDAEMLASAADVDDAAAGLRSALRDVFRSMHKTFGRYGGNANLNELLSNMESFHTKLIDDSESIESRGLTKFSSWTITGTGNGFAGILNTDPQGTQLDISHVDTLTFTCERDQTDGRTRGAELFRLKGGTGPAHNWIDGAIGLDNSYDEPFFGGANLFDSGTPIVAAGQTLASVAAAAGGATGNLIAAGDFAGTAPSATAVAGWDTDSGSVSYETTNVLKQNAAGTAQSLKATANFKISQKLLTGTRPVALRPYFLSTFARRNTGVSAGTLTVKIIDDSGTRATITQDLTGFTVDVWTKTTPVAFVLPATLGNNLRVEIELASYAGANEVLVDHVTLSPMHLVDAGRAIAIHEGVTDWRKTDTITGATTDAATGKNQKRFNTEMGIYIEHAATAVGGWTDPA